MLRILLLAVLVAPTAIAQRPKLVKPYVRKSGTVVQPHLKTTPTKTKLDNYSTKGNVNPMSGKKGTKNPYSLPKSSRKHRR
jgi:hypothetical protein